MSQDASSFIDWFVALLKTTGAKVAPLTPANRLSWGVCYDRLVGLDGRTDEEVRAVCAWARNDPFWRSNFLSPMKLRDKKQGVSYFDRFLTKMNEPDATPKNTSRGFGNSNLSALERYDRELGAEP